MPEIKLAKIPEPIDLMVTYLGHSAINHKVCTIHKASLITGKEDDGIRLLNGFSETASREMNFTTMTFGLVITKPILQKRCAIPISQCPLIRGYEDVLQRRRTKCIKPKPFSRMHNRQLPCHRQHSTFTRGIRKLRRRTTN